MTASHDPLSRRALLAAAAAVAGCGRPSRRTADVGGAEPTTPMPAADFSYTHTQASGNRVGRGQGAVDRAPAVRITPDGRPAWLLAFGGAASRWTVVTTDGRATTHRVESGEARQVVDHGRVVTPPIGYATPQRTGVVTPPRTVATGTRPVPIDGGWLFVAGDGDVVVHRPDRTARLSVAAPPDARPVRVEDGKYALYGRRTRRYGHGALGDRVEGSSLVLVTTGDGETATETRLDAPAAFEGRGPLAADIDGDGRPEIVTTVADERQGARIRVYDAGGNGIATGPVYGPGWRHQLAVAPFGADDSSEIAAVRKPHVDRTVEFYRLRDGDLDVVATHEGYASHTYGSRNTDEGLAGDLDGDGRVELLVPTTDRQHLAAVRRTADGAVRAWTRPLGGSLATNVTGAVLDGGGLAVGAGTADEVRIWQPSG